MIKIKNDDEIIRCDVSTDFLLDNSKFPIKFRVWEEVSNNLIWETELFENMWASFPNKKDIKITVETIDGIILEEKKYHHSVHGCPIYNFWDYFCKMNKDSVGVVFGAGDGTWGEWVLPVNREKIKCHLIEANENDFKKLFSIYGTNLQYKLYNHLITTNGGECEFYIIKNNDGIHTTNLEYLNEWVGGGYEYNTLKKDSVSIKNFLSDVGQVDWIRIDLEGIDYDIIKEIPTEFLKNLKFLQFEHWGLSIDKSNELDNIFYSFGFKKLLHKIDTIYYKKL